jgi:predicted nucleic acid-binding protein
MVLVDAGPLVALTNTGDQHHERCREASRSISGPLGTAWPVVTEAMCLLSFSWRAQDTLWDTIQNGGLELLPLAMADMARVRQLMQKYRDLPMDLADAALVTIAERERISRIFTLDRRDFEVYRPARLGRFSIIP